MDGCMVVNQCATLNISTRIVMIYIWCSVRSFLSLRSVLPLLCPLIEWSGIGVDNG